MSSPRARLLKLEAPEEYHADGLRYADAGFTRDDAAQFRRLIDDSLLVLPKDSGDLGDFLFDHAVQLIVELEGVDALDFLLRELDIALASGDGHFIEHFPDLVVPMGDAAVDPLIAALLTPEHPEMLRVAIATALGEFMRNETATERIGAAFAACLEGEPDLRALKGFLVAEAIDSGALDLLPAVRSAYADNLVDVSICGDLDEVELSFGTRPRRSTPRPNFEKLEADLLSQSRLDRFGPIPLDADDDAVLTHALLLLSSSDGVRDLAQLDGFLTAVVTSPYLLHVSRWSPRVWNPDEHAEQPVWPSMEAAERGMGALMARYNMVIDGVANRTLAPPADGGFDSWLTGLLDGVALWDDQSYDEGSAHDLMVQRALHHFMARAKTENPADPARAFQKILALAKKAYDARSDDPAPPLPGGYDDSVVIPFQRESPKVGRNDPCPCGSGKKFKACCMK